MQFKNKGVPMAGAFWYLLAFLCVQSPSQQQAYATPQAEIKRGGALEKSVPLEEKAYTRYLGPFYKTYDFKGEYMKLLSPGGKVYFLACRHDFAEALAELKKLPKNDTGSALYVKAFCLENLGKHQEAIAAFTAAKAKIDLVFHPGFRFYLQSSRAFLKAGNEKESFKDLKTANEKILDNTPDDQSAGIIMHMIDRRKILMGELKGKYREACEGYLFTFNFRGDQFHLKDSIVADAATKQKAAEWLKGNANVPPGASDVETARFLLTQGKAYLAVANVVAAKSSLEKASALEMSDPPLTQADTVFGAASSSGVPALAFLPWQTSLPPLPKVNAVAVPVAPSASIDFGSLSVRFSGHAAGAPSGQILLYRHRRSHLDIRIELSLSLQNTVHSVKKFAHCTAHNYHAMDAALFEPGNEYLDDRIESHSRNSGQVESFPKTSISGFRNFRTSIHRGSGTKFTHVQTGEGDEFPDIRKTINGANFGQENKCECFPYALDSS